MEPKPHLTYLEQLDLLKARHMLIEDEAAALALLQRIGYYTLSGYSYPFRQPAMKGAQTARFRLGTSIAQVRALWEFDNRLRSAAFVAIQQVETYLRALLAYTLGAIDPMIHRKPELLSIDRTDLYDEWLAKLDRKVSNSREDFIVHHREYRQGVIPVWVAIDILDWGGLTYLHNFAPTEIRENVAAQFQLSAAQLKSWLRALNVVRNVCAHHGRFFNRRYSIKPKLPGQGNFKSLDAVRPAKYKTFAMLTLLRHLSSHTAGANTRILPAAVRTFPTDAGMTIGALGAPHDWETLPLWR